MRKLTVGAMSMKRWTVLGLVVGALSGCGTPATSTQASASPGSPTPESPTPPPLPILNTTAPQNLAFSGSLTGQMTLGKPAAGYRCTVAGGAPADLSPPPPVQSFVVGPLTGGIGTSSVEINMSWTNSFHGAGTYAAAATQDSPVSVGFRTLSGDYFQTFGGTVTLNPDLRSGSIDADLLKNTDGTPSAHVRGTWACPPGA